MPRGAGQPARAAAAAVSGEASPEGAAAEAAARRKDTGDLIGNWGLVRRDGLDGPDLGYALLPAHAGQGFALEAARAVIADAGSRLGLARLHAIVNPDNAGSIRLLQKLGFEFDRMIVLPAIEHAVDLFHLHLSKEATA